MTDRPPVTIEAFTLGPYQTNCYIVRTTRPDGSEGCWIADFSFDIARLLARVDALGLVPEALVLTHAHIDHIAGLGEAKRRFPGAPIWIHRAEERWLLDAELNLSAFSGMPVTAPPADRLLEDGEALDLCGLSWRVLHTPGHSPGGIGLYQAEAGVCLCGDAIFSGSIGRTDFPGSDFETLAESIRAKFYTLPERTRLLPGHGPETTVGEEMRTNPFVRA